jgi:hypothetical protein|tara:strand:+ start:86 stop:259 length:174 start_codon:yes stop_codon:yes gene_type:complete
VDEIIKSHMMEEEQKQHVASKIKKKKSAAAKKDIKEPETETGMDGEGKTKMNTDLEI